MIVFFPHCELFKKLIPWKKYLLDIRTLSVSENESTRNSYNTQIQKACRIYGNVTAISKGVADQIGMSGIKILPLGADVISSCTKIYTDAIRLIYVGTFTNRHIEDTIEGVILFHSDYPEVPISYNIIGYGVNGEEQLFKDIIEKANASSYIHIIGKVPHTQLNQYMDRANIGFSYVPITPYYDYQPPTKTYEYCMSGIFCLGTATAINKELINNSNGLLIDDSASSVCDALCKYWQMKDNIFYTKIAESLSEYKWGNIVSKNLIKFIDNL